MVSVAEEKIRYSPDGAPLGQEEGDPGEHASWDPEFEARLQSAEASLAAARLQLSYARIASPVAGLVAVGGRYRSGSGRMPELLNPMRRRERITILLSN